jgi:hypothetical protein
MEPDCCTQNRESSSSPTIWGSSCCRSSIAQQRRSLQTLLRDLVSWTPDYRAQCIHAREMEEGWAKSTTSIDVLITCNEREYKKKSLSCSSMTAAAVGVQRNQVKGQREEPGRSPQVLGESPGLLTSLCSIWQLHLHEGSVRGLCVRSWCSR